MSEGPNAEAPPINPGPPGAVPLRRSRALAVWNALRRAERWCANFLARRDPRFRTTILVFLAVSVILFVRHPATNYIFDEQEALLANPYVNAAKGLKFTDVIYRDFWGLPPNASIGSYRPIPNVIWRATWQVSKHPWVHHLYNLAIHAINASLLAWFAFAVSRRRTVGWMAGAIFLTSAVITEAVSGIVGIADVLGGLGAIGALCALRFSGPVMPVAVFGAMLLGLFSKESAVVCVPLVPLVALMTAPQLHPQRPARVVRAVLALVATVAAFVLYVELRKEWFPSPLPAVLKEALPVDATDLDEMRRAFFVWFHQAPLPQDRLNNPLVEAGLADRLSGACRVFWRGFTQVLAPFVLSGDYSAPQEPIPNNALDWEGVAGGVLFVFPLMAAVVLAFFVWLWEWRQRRRLVPETTLRPVLATELHRRGRSGLGIPGELVCGLRDPWNRKYLFASVAFATAGGVGLATEFYMVRHDGISWVVTWPYSAALLTVAVGCLVEAWPTVARPILAPSGWPWRVVFALFIALGGTWMVVSFFPHSNIPILLPTVRAERFWYFPVIGTSLVLGAAFAYITEKIGKRRWRRVPLAILPFATFIWFQSIQAYRHSMDYRDDLAFWGATKQAVPRSAKAHLNYSVMVGARGDLEGRLVESHVARQLAPKWAMSHIYTGDTLCRLHRTDEAVPHYLEGFRQGENDRSLIALALQCLYDEKLEPKSAQKAAEDGKIRAFLKYEIELKETADGLPGSWVAYLVDDLLKNHEKNKGIDPKYRPRGYNQGVDE